MLLSAKHFAVAPTKCQTIPSTRASSINYTSTRAQHTFWRVLCDDAGLIKHSQTSPGRQCPPIWKNPTSRRLAPQLQSRPPPDTIRRTPTGHASPTPPSRASYLNPSLPLASATQAATVAAAQISLQLYILASAKQARPKRHRAN